MSRRERPVPCERRFERTGGLAPIPLKQVLFGLFLTHRD